MKKAKNLKKRIRRLEARLQKDAKKLAKLKRRLEAVEKTAAAKPKKKSAAPGKKAAKASKASGSTNKKNQRLSANVKPAATVKELGAVKKVKRKLNLTPERRAQLAAAMKERWAAKRAAAAMNTQHSSSAPGFHPGDASQPQ